MRKFLIKIWIFLLIIAVSDFFLGKAFDYLVRNAKGGDNRRNNYICNEVHEDILIFGSSRAFHHYNPIVISDSLDMPCYNCGQEGNGIILNYGRYQLICQRYHPKLVIYDIIPAFDLLVGEDNHKYLGHLRPYYGRKGVQEIFESVDNTEKIKMTSQMYRYNTRFIQIVSDYVNPLNSEGIKGFRPICEDMDTMKISKKKPRKITPVYDSLKMDYLMKMIVLSKETKIVFIVSPMWNGLDTSSFDGFRKICEKNNIPFIDFSNNPKYVHHNEFFADGAHLNAHGADEYSKDIIKEIRKYIVLN